MPDPLEEREALWYQLQRAQVAAADLESHAHSWTRDLKWVLMESTLVPGEDSGPTPPSLVVTLTAARLMVSRERAREVARRLARQPPFERAATEPFPPVSTPPSTGTLTEDQVTWLENRYLRFVRATLGTLWLLLEHAADSDSALALAARQALHRLELGNVIELLGRRAVEGIHGRYGVQLERAWHLECLLRFALMPSSLLGTEAAAQLDVLWDSILERLFVALNARWFLIDDRTASGLAVCIVAVLLCRMHSSGTRYRWAHPVVVVSTTEELLESLSLEASTEPSLPNADRYHRSGTLTRLLAFLCVLAQTCVASSERFAGAPDGDARQRGIDSEAETPAMEAFIRDDLLELALAAVQELLDGPLAASAPAWRHRLATCNTDPAWALWQAQQSLLEARTVPVRVLVWSTPNPVLLEHTVDAMAVCLQQSKQLSRSFWKAVWFGATDTATAHMGDAPYWERSATAARFWRELCMLLPLTATYVFRVAASAIQEPLGAFLAFQFFQQECVSFAEPWKIAPAYVQTMDTHPARDESGLVVHRLQTSAPRQVLETPGLVLPQGSQGLWYADFDAAIWKVHWDGLLLVPECPAGLALFHRIGWVLFSSSGMMQMERLDLPSPQAPGQEPDGTDTQQQQQQQQQQQFLGAHKATLSSIQDACNDTATLNRYLQDTREQLWIWLETHWTRLRRVLMDYRQHRGERELHTTLASLPKAQAMATLMTIICNRYASSGSSAVEQKLFTQAVDLLDPAAPVPKDEAEALWLARAWMQLAFIPSPWHHWLVTLPADLETEAQRSPATLLESVQVRYALVTRALEKSLPPRKSATKRERPAGASTWNGAGGYLVPTGSNAPSALEWPWWQHQTLLDQLWMHAWRVVHTVDAIQTELMMHHSRAAYVLPSAVTNLSRAEVRHASEFTAAALSLVNCCAGMCQAVLCFQRTMLTVRFSRTWSREALVRIASDEVSRGADFAGSQHEPDHWLLQGRHAKHLPALWRFLWRTLHPQAPALAHFETGPACRARTESIARGIAADIWDIWALLHLGVRECLDASIAEADALSELWPTTWWPDFFPLVQRALQVDPEPVLCFLLAALAVDQPVLLDNPNAAALLVSWGSVTARVSQQTEERSSSAERRASESPFSSPASGVLRSSRLWQLLWDEWRCFIPTEQRVNLTELAPLGALFVRLGLGQVSTPEVESWLTMLFRDMLIPWRKRILAKAPDSVTAVAVWTTSIVLACFLELVNRLWMRSRPTQGVQRKLVAEAAPKSSAMNPALVSAWTELITLLCRVPTDDIETPGKGSATSSPPASIGETEESQRVLWPEGQILWNKHYRSDVTGLWSVTTLLVLQTILSRDLDVEPQNRRKEALVLQSLATSDQLWIPWLHQTVLATNLELLLSVVEAPQPSTERPVLTLPAQQASWSVSLKRLEQVLLRLCASDTGTGLGAMRRLAWTELIFRLSRLEAAVTGDNAASCRTTGIAFAASAALDMQRMQSHVRMLLQTLERQLDRLEASVMSEMKGTDDWYPAGIQSWRLLRPDAETSSVEVLLEVGVTERLVLALCKQVVHGGLHREAASTIYAASELAYGEGLLLRLLERSARWPSLQPATALLCQFWLSPARLDETEWAKRFLPVVFSALCAPVTPPNKQTHRWWLVLLLLNWAVRSARCADVIIRQQQGLWSLGRLSSARIHQRLTPDGKQPTSDFMMYLMLLRLYAVLLQQARAHTTAATQQRLRLEVYAFVSSFEGAPTQLATFTRHWLDTALRLSESETRQAWSTTYAWHWAMLSEFSAIAGFLEALLTSPPEADLLPELESQWSPEWLQQRYQQVGLSLAAALRCLRMAPRWLSLPLPDLGMWTHASLRGSLAEYPLMLSNSMKDGIGERHTQTSISGTLTIVQETLADKLEQAMGRLISIALHLTGHYGVWAPMMTWTDLETPTMGLGLMLVLHWLQGLNSSSEMPQRQRRRILLLEGSLLLFLKQLVHHNEHGTLPLGFAEECGKRLAGLEHRLRSQAEDVLPSTQRSVLLRMLQAVETLLLVRGRTPDTISWSKMLLRKQELAHHGLRSGFAAYATNKNDA